MGLYCTIDLASDWGFPNRTPKLGLPIDYTSAINAFSDTFMRISREEVPVNTGYLKSSLSCSGSGMIINAEAKAEYAQYVEYGTWRCPAQPYFYPAIASASDVGFKVAEKIYNQAIKKELWMVEQAYKAETQMRLAEASGGGGGLIGWLFSLFAQIIVQTLATLFYEFTEDIFGEDEY